MNEKIDWNKVTIEGQEPVVDSGEVAAEAQEGEITPEILSGNVENLQANIGKIDGIPQNVLESAEGKEETKSLGSRIAERVKEMGHSITERLAKLDDWKFRDKFQTYAVGAGSSILLGPALVQWARTQFPEVGVVLDSAPDALQQIIHMDIYSHLVNALSGSSLESFWQGGSAEVNNMLADIASGRIDASSLSMDQVHTLRESTGSTADLITHFYSHGNAEKGEYFARGSSMIAMGLKGVTNATLFTCAAAPVYWLSQKIGKLAGNKQENNN